jgi:MFS family permease
MKKGKIDKFAKDLQFRKFQAYGFLKNLQLFEPFLMLFLLEKGISFLQIGSLYAIREIALNILEIPSGILADLWGKRRTLAGSFLFYIASFMTFYFSNNFAWFIIAMLLFAFGDAFRTGTHKAMIFEYLRIKKWEEYKVSYYGHTRGASQIGSALSALLAASVVFITGNYSLIFLLSTLPFLINFFLILSYPKSLDGETENISIHEVPKAFKQTFRTFTSSFRSGKLFSRLIRVSLYSGYYKAIKDYLQPLIKTAVAALPFFLIYSREQRTAILIGIVYFLIYILNSFSSKNSGKLFEKMKSYQKALTLTMFLGVLAGVAAGILNESSLKLLAILPFLMIYILENIRKPIGIAYISENMKGNVLASSLSAESQLSSIIAGTIAIVLGFLADKLAPGYGISLVSLFIIFLIPFLISSKKKRITFQQLSE